MRRSAYRFVFAVVLTWISARASAGAAASEKHFQGPYHITTSAPRRIRATVQAAYRYPNMVAQEWLVAYPLPPEFDAQPAARGSIRIVEAPFAEPGRTTDESALRQALATLHWFPDSDEGTRGFTVEATYNVTLTRRTLVAGASQQPAPELTRAERSGFLAPSRHFDFTSSKFQAWLRKHDLKRKPAERDLDFAHRAIVAMVQTHKYRFELLSDRSASAVCKAGWSDCGGLSTVYVSILRANGIPARCLSGRTLKPHETHVRLDFYADGVGWVPADPAVAIAAHSADAGFGRERSDMVIMHFDLIRFQQQYCWLQGIGGVRSINQNDEGSGAGMTLEHTLTFETLPVGAEPAPTDSGAVKSTSRKRKSAANRRRLP